MFFLNYWLNRKLYFIIKRIITIRYINLFKTIGNTNGMFFHFNSNFLNEQLQNII